MNLFNERKALMTLINLKINKKYFNNNRYKMKVLYNA